ncbi:Serine/threonine protein kinase [hydrothermal vent metagenome]|uniref:Serine/threonine protein kinase n=1 Tax=hydrothermal vent metagenome TaxID=652676 RepID=A0A3B0ZVB3_9ZZZZ
MKKTLAIESAHQCLAGGKAQNEDTCGIQVADGQLLKTKGIAAAIADGMSGSDAGKEASQACVKGFLNDYFSTPETWTVQTSAHKIISALNHWLHGNGQRKYQSHKGMVTTLSALVLKSNTGFIFHVGDTRIYRLRGKEFKQLTHDHRVQINENKSLLSRAVGIDVRLDIDYRSVPLEINDTFVMVSDGIHEFITDNRMTEIIQQHTHDLQLAANEITQEAINNKTNDNVTCQIVRITSLPGENEEEFYQKLTELPFPPVLEPGMILDGYKILRHLFSNKRTEVYLAQDTHSNENVVLKAPSVNYNDDAEYISLFLHEEWAGRRINSPHVMKVLEIPRKRTALYYIAEHIQGRTLRQWMEDEPRANINTVRDFVEQIARGLRAFHRLEMIHQDLKPENILVDENGTLKIIDFGSTKIAGIDEISTPIQFNNILGTINYTAPEYHIGTTGSNRSDIFSLGVITYELLSGHLPYGKELTAKNIRKVNYISIKHYNPEVPAWVDKALKKAVNINPDQRFTRLSEFIAALNNPNSRLVNTDYVPLIKRNPVRVWQVISAILLITNIILFYIIALKH